jgi:hypothetical protein
MTPLTPVLIDQEMGAEGILSFTYRDLSAATFWIG